MKGCPRAFASGAGYIAARVCSVSQRTARADCTPISSISMQGPNSGPAIPPLRFSTSSRKPLKRISPILVSSVQRSNWVIHIKALGSATNQAWLRRARNLLVKDSSVIKKSTVVTQRLFRTRDAANYLGMSTWAIRQEVSKGELPFISSGEHTSSWKFDVGDLDAWVERHRVNY